MAYTTNKAIRADDVSGLNIATKSETSEDALTKHFQRVIIEDGTTIGQQLAINATGQITVASIAGALPAGTAAIGKLAANSGVDIGDVDVTTIPGTAAEAGALPAVFVVVAGDDGVDTQPLQLSAGGDLKVTLDSETVVLGAGTAAFGKLAANTGVDIGDVDVLSIAAGDNNIGNVDVVTLPNVTLAAGTNTNEVVGDVADDAVAAGNPVQIAGVCKNFDSTDPGNVSAEGDAAALTTDNNRRLYVNDAHPNFWNVSVDYAAAQTNATVKAAPGVGLKLYITDIVISNGAVAGNITLLDGSGGTVKFEIYPGINGGGSIQFKSPIALTANTALVITSTTCTTHAICVGGFTAP